MLNAIQEASPLLATAGLTLLHFLWQGCLVALVLAIVLGLTDKGAARLRYALGCTAMVLLAVGPVVTFAVLWPETAASSPAVALEAAPLASAPAAVEAKPLPPAAEARLREQAIAAGDRGEALSQKLRVLMYRAMPWLPLAWGIGVGVMSLRLVAGALGVAVLRRRRVELADLYWRTQVRRLAARMGIWRPVTLLVSELAHVPMVVGWLRPAVVVPVAMLTGLTPGQLRLLLAHELSHLSRWDNWVNLAQLLLETLLFYHPAVWWVSGRIREEREHCCDDAAAALCDDAVQYAEALAAMAGLRRAAPSMALSAAGGSLLGRIRRLLDPPCPGPQGGQRGLAGLVALVLVVGFAVATRATVAQDQEARYVEFPEGSSLGQLYIRDGGKSFNTAIIGAGNAEGWRTYSQASGLVEVPAGAELMLALRATAVSQLSELSKLNPDDLQKLDLVDCGLKDEDLEHIAGLTGLRSLVLSTNRDLTDAGLEHLKGLTSLVWLSLEKTGVACDSAFFDGLSELTYLDVYDTRLNDAGFVRLCRLPQLKTLGIEKAQLSQESLAALRNLRTIEEANFEATTVSDATLEVLGELPALRYLNVARTDISDAGLEFLAETPALEVLNIKFTSVGDGGIALLKTAPSLKRVETEGSQVTKEGLARLASAPAALEEDAEQVVQHSTNPEAPRVGLLMSHFTATGPHWIAKPYGYQHQFTTTMAAMLEEANFDVYAVIEPDTADKGELPDVLAATRLAGKTVDGTDPKALSQLNAIFVKSALNVTDSMIQAVQTAVGNGAGLVVTGSIGHVTPGGGDLLGRLMRIDRPTFFWNGGQPVTCTVAANHPILAPLKVGDSLELSSLFGLASEGTGIEGQALLTAPDEGSTNFCPMYVSSFGKGRIVSLQWFDPAMPNNPFPGRWDLYIRAVNWAANRPADTEW
ncbi:MAG: M56 family metallopeptidase [FCB group bacterium]|jgi:beta-lactamase regulating signal transducer with metallopeptidase domain|nr:M56 family metallopeptidase [FCB group bacterium]